MTADAKRELALADVLPLRIANALERLGVFTVGDLEVLIFDPAYLMMPGGDASNLFIQGEMLRNLSKLCEQLGVTMVLCHHTKKGLTDPYSPPELEDIAWAGFQEFARQWWLVHRTRQTTLQRTETVSMSDTVHVHFFGGGLDGLELTYFRSDFRCWDGFRPSEWFGPYRRRYFYQSDEPYHDGDHMVTMRLVAIACVVDAINDDLDDESSYDGWLASRDRFDHSEGGV